MSKEYIDRNASLKAIDEIFSKTDQKSEEQIGVLKCRAAIREMEAADVAEVVHGEWIDNDDRCYCNRCFEFSCTVTDDTGTIYNDLTKFCPNCGAKMKRRKSQ